ncbi:MAG TPA: hypothetical protein VNL18_07625 [Gemmatimonadales bacterium]|nr:hypothetical protein [Gemmatimonadales bacterium]
MRLGGSAVSVLVHVVVLALLIVLYRPHLPLRRVTLIPLDAGEAPVMTYVPPAESARVRRAEPRRVDTPSIPTVEDVPPVVVRVPAGQRGDSAGGPRVAARPRVRIGPGYGDGRLWIPPIDVLALGRVLASEPEGGAGGGGPPGTGQMDSVLTSRLFAFLDSLPPDSFAPPAQPKWTTEIGGKTWGIDGRWIYLGGLKLPAALLALLPIQNQGNYDQQRAARELQRMRDDILQAAQRAANSAEFKKYVDELRKRRDAERDMRRRVPRDTIIP